MFDRLPAVAVVAVVIALATLPAPARAERCGSAYDPALHARPPTVEALDGRARSLVVDADFLARAAAFRRANPQCLRQTGAIVQRGEVVILEGTDEVLVTEG